MYISDVRIENYRTFQDVTFHFDSRANYIVGDNNIGKSNFLSFLKTVTHGYGFREADFLDTVITYFTQRSSEFEEIEERKFFTRPFILSRHPSQSYCREPPVAVAFLELLGTGMERILSSNVVSSSSLFR